MSYRIAAAFPVFLAGDAAALLVLEVFESGSPPCLLAVPHPQLFQPSGYWIDTALSVLFVWIAFALPVFYSEDTEAPLPILREQWWLFWEQW
jgi:hypothetical protein